MMTLKPMLIFLTWALILEIFVILYYLMRKVRPMEFYLSIFLLIGTIVALVFFVRKLKKEIEGRNHERR